MTEQEGSKGGFEHFSRRHGVRDFEEREDTALARSDCKDRGSRAYEQAYKSRVGPGADSTACNDALAETNLSRLLLHGVSIVRSTT
jgi:hypothetical protein